MTNVEARNYIQGGCNLETDRVFQSKNGEHRVICDDIKHLERPAVFAQSLDVGRTVCTRQYQATFRSLANVRREYT